MGSPGPHLRSAYGSPSWLPLLVLACGFMVHPSAAQTFENLMSRGAEAESRYDPSAALPHYRRALALRPNDAGVHYRVAKQLFDQTFLTRDAEDIQRLAEEALPFAERALQIEETAPNLIAVAVLYGQIALYGDNRTKVDYARRIRRHAERALEIDPNYAWAHHVLGRWHVEISKLGLAKRMVVAVLYGGLPRARLPTGIKHLQRAVALEPDAVAHLVELGFAYRTDGRNDLALQAWTAALENKSNAIYDRAARTRARVGLRRLESDAVAKG